MQIDICVLNLLNLLANCYCFPGDSFVFFTSMIRFSTNNDSLFFLCNTVPFVLTGISSTMLNKEAIVGILISFLITWYKLQSLYC